MNYLPQQFVITRIRDLTDDTKIFAIRPGINFTPGQFVLAGISGIGEAPISIASSPSKKKFELVIRRVGAVTEKLHQTKVGGSITIRGPHGNGFPLKKLRSKNILIISGGCGLAGLRSIINYLKIFRQNFGNVQIFYGAKNPEAILFKDEIKQWQKFAEIMITVDTPSKSWRGNTGLITNLITPTTIDTNNAVALLCGPPIMFQAVSEKLVKLGFGKDNIYASLERNMRCGIGVCQHCTCGTKYVCKDGPVFSLEEIETMGNF